MTKSKKSLGSVNSQIQRCSVRELYISSLFTKEYYIHIQIHFFGVINKRVLFKVFFFLSKLNKNKKKPRKKSKQKTIKKYD